MQSHLSLRQTAPPDIPIPDEAPWFGPSIDRSSTGHGLLSFNACLTQSGHGPTRTRRSCASSGDNVGKGHTKDSPSDVATYHSRSALPVPSPEFGGCGLSKSEGTGTSGSWLAPYSGKSPTVQHLADDWRTGLQPRGRHTPWGRNWPLSPFFTLPT